MQAAELKLNNKAHNSPEQPPALPQLTHDSIQDVDTSMHALKRQMKLSLPLASPPPSVPANDQHSLAPVRLVCTELTNQLAPYAHLQLACRSADNCRGVIPPTAPPSQPSEEQAEQADEHKKVVDRLVGENRRLEEENSKLQKEVERRKRKEKEDRERSDQEAKKKDDDKAALQK